MGRQIRDAQFSTTKYLPAATATNYTNSFDLGASNFKPEGIELEVAVPALANHTDSAKSITLTLQDSADNSSFTNVEPLIQSSVAGVASTGSVAVTKTFRPPSGVRRYVRIAQAVPSGDGDNTGGLITFSVLF